MVLDRNANPSAPERERTELPGSPGSLILANLHANQSDPERARITNGSVRSGKSANLHANQSDPKRA